MIHYRDLGAGLRTDMMKVSSGETRDPSPGAGLIILFLLYFITYGPSVVRLIIPVAVMLLDTSVLEPGFYINRFSH